MMTNPWASLTADERLIAELLQTLRDLEEWAGQTGGWDAPAWTRLKRTLNRARREGR